MKENKDVFEQEIKNRLTEGQELLARLEQSVKESTSGFDLNLKKRKYYKD